MNIEEKDFEYILNDNNLDFSRFSNKTVLITGASGMLSSYMAKTLLYLNSLEKYPPCKVICLVRNIMNARMCFYNFLNDENLVIREHDVCNQLEIDDEVDFIIHAASKASGKFFYSDPVDVINANTLGTNNMLNLAKEKKAESFLYFSSGEVLGDIYSKKEIVKESDYGIIDPYDVRNCYALSKKMGESMCYCWFYQYNIPVKTVRPSHTYGPGFKENDDRAFAQFVMCAVNKQDIVLKSDGSAKRSFVYIADAIRAYFNVLLNGNVGEVYNVSNDHDISIKNLAELICKLTGNEIKVKYEIRGTNQSSPSTNGLEDISKIKLLDWEPKISEEDGFKRTIDFYRQKKEFVLGESDYIFDK